MPFMTKDQLMRQRRLNSFQRRLNSLMSQNPRPGGLFSSSLAQQAAAAPPTQSLGSLSNQYSPGPLRYAAGRPFHPHDWGAVEGHYQHGKRRTPQSGVPPLPKGVLPGQGQCYGYVTGFRTWELCIEAAETPLQSKQLAWVPGAPVRAENLGELGYGYGGGIYAMKPGEEVPVFEDMDQVGGLVALWGQIFEHEKGYRAEYAYPLWFCVLGGASKWFKQSILDALNELYGCRKPDGYETIYSTKE